MVYHHMYYKWENNDSKWKCSNYRISFMVSENNFRDARDLNVIISRILKSSWEKI